MAEITAELAFLLNIIGEKVYRKPPFDIPRFDELNINNLIYLAIKNNVLYYASKKILESYRDEVKARERRLLGEICRLGDLEVVKIKNSLDLLNSHVGEYVVIKTFKGYLRIPDDVDIVVKDFDGVISSLEKTGMRLISYFKDVGEADLKRDDCTQIHVHREASWSNLMLMDQSLVWEKSKKTSIEELGASFKSPCVELDLIIHIAHINFELLYITLADLMYLFRLMPRVDWDLVLQQVCEFRWMKTFERTLDILQGLHYAIYSGKEMCIVSLPYELSRTHMFTAFIEKKAYGKIRPIIAKALAILITGKTYGIAKPLAGEIMTFREALRNF